jgi:hypothetical protein
MAKRVYKKGAVPPQLVGKGFVKGDPRINRNGSPKKEIRLKRLMTEMFGIEDGMDVKDSDLGKMVKKMAEITMKKGNVNAFNAIMDRMYGKPKQTIEMEQVEDKRKEVADLFPFKESTNNKKE